MHASESVSKAAVREAVAVNLSRFSAPKIAVTTVHRPQFIRSLLHASVLGVSREGLAQLKA
jgi:hypothetical protein